LEPKKKKKEQRMERLSSDSLRPPPQIKVWGRVWKKRKIVGLLGRTCIRQRGKELG